MTKVHDLRNMKDLKVISLNTSTTGIDFMDGLALLLIGLKLTEHLETWTWMEVLSPLWAPFMIGWFLKLVKSTFFTRIESDDDEQ